MVIRGGQFVADSAIVFADGNTGDAGQVDIKVSDTIQASNGTLITADQFGSGTPGQMTIEAKRVVLESGARLQLDNYGSGTGGNLNVVADSLEIEGRSAADIPIIGDPHVDQEFGTGCVKITPAHDFDDYQMGERHNLPLINIFTSTAHISDDAPLAYRGLDRFEARKKVVADLDQLGLLQEIEPHKLMIPRGDRSGAIVEP